MTSATARSSCILKAQAISLAENMTVSKLFEPAHIKSLNACRIPDLEMEELKLDDIIIVASEQLMEYW